MYKYFNFLLFSGLIFASPLQAKKPSSPIFAKILLIGSGCFSAAASVVVFAKQPKATPKSSTSAHHLLDDIASATDPKTQRKKKRAAFYKKRAKRRNKSLESHQLFDYATDTASQQISKVRPQNHPSESLLNEPQPSIPSTEDGNESPMPEPFTQESWDMLLGGVPLLDMPLSGQETDIEISKEHLLRRFLARPTSKDDDNFLMPRKIAQDLAKLQDFDEISLSEQEVQDFLVRQKFQNAYKPEGNARKGGSVWSKHFNVKYLW